MNKLATILTAGTALAMLMSAQASAAESSNDVEYTTEETSEQTNDQTSDQNSEQEQTQNEDEESEDGEWTGEEEGEEEGEPEVGDNEWENDYEFPAAEAIIVNGQINLGTVWSTNNINVTDTEGTVYVSASAVGNTATIVTLADTHVDNVQEQIGDVGAEVTATVSGVGEDVLLGATALCNGADISTDPAVTAVNSSQKCMANDPVANVTADISNVAGGVGISALAVANQFQADSNAAYFPVTNYQENIAGTYANVNATITNAAAGVTSTATAVGNTAQIVHFQE